MTIPLELFGIPASSASLPPAAPPAIDPGFTIRIMSPSEDSTLLLTTVCTDKVPHYAAIGSQEFEATASEHYGANWRTRPLYRSARARESATHTIQFVLVLKRIKEMPEVEQRRQYAAVGINCGLSFEVMGDGDEC
jgi:hypothetical protein